MPRDRDQELAIARAFGARVKDLRTQAGLTQERVAELADFHPTFISNVERGYRVPTLPTVLRLAVALEQPPSTLIDGLAWES